MGWDDGMMTEPVAYKVDSNMQNKLIETSGLSS